MFRVYSLILTLLLAGASVAQTQTLPPDLAGLPQELKSLPWKSIDVNALSDLERCRTLLLLNHVLDELSANVTSEADLMSSYIEQQKLGTAFANTPVPPSPEQLGYPEAKQVAAALLRGPMSSSYYATELTDISPAALTSYAQMYERTCQRRWSEFDESRHQVRCMTSFLGNSGKLDDYDSWATAESARREADYHQQHQAEAPNADQKQLQQTQQELRQVQGALGVAEYQQQQAQAGAQAQPGAAQAQQGAAQASQGAAQEQQQPAQAQQQTAAAVYAPGYAVPVYGGYGGYGYAAGAYAAGANAEAAQTEAQRANAARAAAATPGHVASPYHAANASWNHSPSYNSAARAQTENRMSGFHGAGGAGRR